MDMKKSSETRLEMLLAVKKLCKEQAFDEIVPYDHREKLTDLFTALDDAIGAEVHMLDGGD